VTLLIPGGLLAGGRITCPVGCRKVKGGWDEENGENNIVRVERKSWEYLELREEEVERGASQGNGSYR